MQVYYKIRDFEGCPKIAYNRIFFSATRHMHENFTYWHLLLVEANGIVSFCRALYNMFKRTAVDSYGRHTGSRVNLKIFFCLCLRNDY